MSFDISTATAPNLDAGTFMHLADASGALLYDDNKQPVGITMRGRNSREGLAAARAIGNRRLNEMRRPGSQPTTVESNERTSNEILAGCTISWTFTELDGQPFPCTPENVFKFWSDDRFRRWRDQADAFIDSEANFLKG